MSLSSRINRRTALSVLGATAAASWLDPLEAADSKSNVNQSVCRWCYGKIPLDQLAVAAAKIGYKSIELLRMNEVKTVKAAGLTCAVLSCGNIENGWNRKENHAKLGKELREGIEFAAAEGLPNVICFSGNRKGLADDEGLATCAVGLKEVMGLAESKGVTVIMEGLNSKVNHRDYMYDKTAWGVALCKKIGSPRFKLLYDIYHMQIMEGDVIRTIQQNKEYMGHYHTGGNPGRNEIDETQELNYPAIMKAILATGYTGYVGQEFIPKRDPLASLAQGYSICNV